MTPNHFRPRCLPLFGLLTTLLGAVGCDEPEPGAATPEASSPTPIPLVDNRPQFPPPPATGMQVLTPEVTIQPGQEHLFCYFTTYTGEDAAVTGASIYQSKGGHHNLVFVTQTSLYEDNQLVDCDLADQPALLATSSLLVFPEPVSADVQESVLPEGMAIKFGRNTRLMLQMHYINPTDHPVLVQDVVNLNFIDPQSVKTWAAPFTHSDVRLTLPPNQVTTSSLKCPFTGNFGILFLSGHMHWYGQKFEATLTRAEESEVIYRVDEWQPDYMELPPIDEYGVDEFQVRAGDVLTTTCTWNNTTDSPIEFPGEMCATFGLIYPSDRPVECTKAE